MRGKITIWRTTMKHTEILYPLQTSEQSKNTTLFLTELVADCYGTGDRCMIGISKSTVGRLIKG